VIKRECSRRAPRAVLKPAANDKSPKGARFDSPGRQPWGPCADGRKAPTGRDSKIKGHQSSRRNLAPLGLTDHFLVTD
jgi:hypothetical protein